MPLFGSIYRPPKPSTIKTNAFGPERVAMGLKLFTFDPPKIVTLIGVAVYKLKGESKKRPKFVSDLKIAVPLILLIAMVPCPRTQNNGTKTANRKTAIW